MDERGTSGFWAAQVAALDTRDRKEHVDLVRLREEWRARAAEHGLGRAELDAVMHRVPWQEPTSRELLEIARGLLGPTGLTERSTAFSDPDLVMAWSEAHAQGASAERVRRLAARFVGMNGVEPVGEAAQPGRPARYSTRELLETERAALALVERGIASDAPSVSAEATETTVRETPTLTAEQTAMLRAVASSPDRVICVVGLAGSGKTTAARAVADAFRAARVPVIGAAPSGIAAEKLQDETGIPSTTLHRLLQQPLPERCLVVVDEAGMAETRILAPLLERVEQAQAKIVLIGDASQLPAVGAGGLFTGIVERHGAIELGENRRQRDRDERRALESIRNGLGRDYLAFAEGNGRLISSDAPVRTKIRLLSDWWEAARSDLSGNVMIALRRRDVAELNALAHALMDSHGRLGRKRLTVAGAEYAAGDRIVCLRNDNSLGVKNGTRATVEAVDRKHRTLTAVTDRGDRIELGGRYLEVRPRPPRIRAHRARRPGRHRRARLRARHRRTATPGVGLRRPLPCSPGDAPLRHRRRRASARATSTTSTTATPSPGSDRHSRSRRSNGSPSTSARSRLARSMTRRAGDRAVQPDRRTTCTAPAPRAGAPRADQGATASRALASRCRAQARPTRALAIADGAGSSSSRKLPPRGRPSGMADERLSALAREMRELRAARPRPDALVHSGRQQILKPLERELTEPAIEI